MADLIEPEGFRAKTEADSQDEAALAAIKTRDKAFAWNAWSDDIHRRVALKQDAIDNALHHALDICRALRAPSDDQNPAAASREERCGRELVEWMGEIDRLHEENQAFEVLVGVSGRTGAGKSTILNMLLEIPELLPSSNSEAATSCACRVSWNPDDTPGHQFKAEVIFRSLEDVHQELEDILARFQKRQLFNQDSDSDDVDEPFQRMEEEAALESAIAEGFKKINAVWGLDEETVKDMSAQDLIASNPEVLGLLGTTKTFSSEDAEIFAEQVKPYMDSSENIQGFRAWPLVTEVRLFVKADFLKHGVVLVDLPGLSDAVESRAQVANKFSQRLNIVVIVTPARRAIDEKTGVQLMSDYQTLQMQLDGKYHKKTFCVAVSQIDEIDCDVFIKGDSRAKRDEEIRKGIEVIKKLTQKLSAKEVMLKQANADLSKKTQKVTKANKKIRDIIPTGPGSTRMKRDKSFREKLDEKLEKAKAEKRALAVDRGNQQRLVNRISSDKARTDEQLSVVRARQKWACIWLRNRHITNAIKRDFAQRQKALVRELGGGKEYDGSVDVIPVSATAFRDHLKGRQPKDFPTKRHTGIPLLRQWLADSTLERREEHLDACLNALRRLFMSLQQWLSINSGGQKIQFSREIVEDLIFRVHGQFTRELGEMLQRASDGVQTLDPFKQVSKGQVSCRRVACRTTTRWVVRFPDDKTSAVPMHWLTFDAVLRRKGGPYYSKAREKQEYDFPKAMAGCLLTLLVHDWHKTFHVQIPAAEEPIMRDIDKVWQKYMDDLRDQIHATAPDILPHFEEGLEAIQGIKNELRGRVKAALRSLSESASEIHPEFLGSLREKLAPIFEESVEIKGTGHFHKRREFLYNQVKEQCVDLFMAGYAKMNEKYQANVTKLPRAFDDTAEFIGSRVMAQITLLLDQLAGASGEEWAVADMQPSLQQRLHHVVQKWRMEWVYPRVEEVDAKRGEVGIPKEYAVEGGDVVAEKVRVKRGPVLKVKVEDEDEGDPMDEDDDEDED